MTDAPHAADAEALVARAQALAQAAGVDLQARLATGEGLFDHARGTLEILGSLHVDDATRAAAALYTVAGAMHKAGRDYLGPIERDFGTEVATLVRDIRKLLDIGSRAAGSSTTIDDPQQRRAQVETLRKMLLAFAQDIRVVLVRLASRLQSLRWWAKAKRVPPADMAIETLELYAPLANRLGIWQLKWELEDLAFRFEQPDVYRQIATLLDEKRGEREGFIAAAIARLKKELAAAAITADVSGRPKHIYSIWKKMRGKSLDFADLYDVRAFRIIVADIKDCYTVLGIVHNLWQPVPKEFDDYISRPKPNGYRSLHTVVVDDEGRAFEVQIRTREMHHFAEYGIAAHWRYKEAGAKGYGGQFAAGGGYDDKIAVVRQLLAWKDDAAQRDAPWSQLKSAPRDDHIYVLTPAARVVALPHGATPVDFAYYLHSDIGHRCRGARVDGAMVPLNTRLANGQTVEVITVKQGGPSRDWLNLELGYLASPRARAKVRAWFNAQELEETIAHGRNLIEKTLQREGKTAVKFDELAHRLGFKSPELLFAQVAKDEFSLRHVEQALRDQPAAAPVDEIAGLARQSRATSVARGAQAGVLIEGVGSLLTQLARCCKPAPPDPIVGFVTVGKGVAIHRDNCPTFARLAARAAERVIDAGWGASGNTLYPVDIAVTANDRQGLLRDISEVFSREKINVTGVRTLSKHGVAKMAFTAEIPHAQQLVRALALIAEVPGVLAAQRK